MKNKFKVGDRVKVAKNYQHLYNSCGVGTVIEAGTNGTRCEYLVKFDDKECRLSFYSYQLDKVEVKKNKPIQMIELRKQDIQPSYKYKVGDKVTLTKDAIEWLKKFDRGTCIKEYLYDTVFEVSKLVTDHNIPAYLLNDCVNISFYDEDLNSAPLPKYNIGQKVWLTSKTVEQLRKDKIDIKEVLESFEIVSWYYYKGKVLYNLDRVKGLYFYEYELTTKQPIEFLGLKMKQESIKQLKQRWIEVCIKYVQEFCERHGYKYDPDTWVRGEVGTTIEIADMFISMDDIRYDVDNNIPSPDFETWYWKSLELYELGVKDYMNYSSYCEGAPDIWTEERVNKLRQSHKRLQEIREDFERAIEEYKHNSVSKLF